MSMAWIVRCRIAPVASSISAAAEARTQIGAAVLAPVAPLGAVAVRSFPPARSSICARATGASSGWMMSSQAQANQFLGVIAEQLGKGAGWCRPPRRPALARNVGIERILDDVAQQRAVVALMEASETWVSCLLGHWPLHSRMRPLC